MLESTITPDEQRLKGFTKRLRNQYNLEPTFLGVESHDKTDGGVYVFEVQEPQGKTRRLFYWNFMPNVAGGQMAMDIALDEKSGAQAVDSWLAYRKLADKQRG